MQRIAMLGAGAVAVAVAGILLKASTEPEEYHVERSILTDASAQDVYQVFSDFSRFHEWSPWQRLDPDMATELTGDQGHVGASYSWSGNAKVGAGSMTIIEAVAPAYVQIRLEFLRPFVASGVAVWRVSEEDGRRRVSWSMDGSNDTLLKRAFALIANMDKMLGKDLDAGLAALKTVVESASVG